MKSLLCSGHFPEHFFFMQKICLIFSGDHKRLIRTFHFAEVRYPVISLNDKIYLGAAFLTFTGPRKASRPDAGDSETGLDLIYVLKTCNLKGTPSPIRKSAFHMRKFRITRCDAVF